jgi:hypothetical protein
MDIYKKKSYRQNAPVVRVRMKQPDGSVSLHLQWTRLFYL